jgi:hypothetical protein
MGAMKTSQQKSTTDDFSLDIKRTPVTFEMLDIRQQNWVDYNAVQGVITESDGAMVKMTVSDFARQIGVDRTTVYLWSKEIPNFWEIVNKRRKAMMTGARTQKVWNSLFLNATVKMNVKAQELWLANADPEFRVASQKIEHEVGGGLADLLNKARSLESTASTCPTLTATCVMCLAVIPGLCKTRSPAASSNTR